MIKFKKIGIFVLVVLMISLGLVLIFLHKSNVNQDRIRVITEDSSWGMITQEDTIYGFNYELAREFADEYQLELEMSIENNLEKSLKDLVDENVDVVACFIPNTASLSERFYVTQSWINSRLILVQKFDSSQLMVSSPQEIAGHTITLPSGSPYVNRMNALSDEIADEIKVQEIDCSLDQLISDVSKGTYSKTVCPEFMTASYHAKYPNLDFSVPVGFLQEYVWVCRKEDAQLIEKLKTFLDSYLLSGSFLVKKNNYLNN